MALIRIEVPNVYRWLWKLKVPLKIKIFLWYLRRGVTLTKDNLAKHNWQRSKTCCFCHKEETIRHLFFDCRLARAIWSIANLALGINKPHSSTHMFGNWLGGLDKKLRPLVLLGAAAICWSIWLKRNNVVFEKPNYDSPVQVIHVAIKWLCT